MTDLMKKYRVTFTYEEEVEATDRWEALIASKIIKLNLTKTAGSNGRILEHLGSDATVEELTQ